MNLLLISAAGSAISFTFFKWKLFGPVDVFSLIAILTFFYYIKTIVTHGRSLARGNLASVTAKSLIIFCVFGLFIVCLSLTSFSAFLPVSNLLYDLSYIPRQAYYYFFIPLIVLAGITTNADRALRFTKRHYKIIFLIIYCSFVLQNSTFALGVSASLVLGFLLLLGDERDKVSSALLLLILEFSPIHVGGESTQLIIRLLLLAFYCFKDSNSLYRRTRLFGLIGVIACLLVPLIVPSLSHLFDANSSWRLLYWNDQLLNLVHSYGLGVGYGTSYASLNFVGPVGAIVSGPFAPDAEYSYMEKLFVVGSHNSFVAVAFRTGVVGITSLLAAIFSQSQQALYASSVYNRAASFGLISSVVMICFNVGLESPGYFFVFAACMAIKIAIESGSGQMSHGNTPFCTELNSRSNRTQNNLIG